MNTFKELFLFSFRSHSHIYIFFFRSNCACFLQKEKKPRGGPISPSPSRTIKAKTFLSLLLAKRRKFPPLSLFRKILFPPPSPLPLLFTGHRGSERKGGKDSCRCLDNNNAKQGKEFYAITMEHDGWTTKGRGGGKNRWRDEERRRWKKLSPS